MDWYKNLKKIVDGVAKTLVIAMLIAFVVALICKIVVGG